jgi:DNA-binding transcriptional LysR family regulator
MDRFTSMSTFVQVVDSGGFSGAARRLELSPATVTAHVQSLEQQLGIRLLNRSTRKVSLTGEGATFYQRCVRILAEVAAAEDLATSLRSAPRGKLRLNTDVALARVVAPILAEYAQLYPDVSVELIMTDRIADLVEGQFDLAMHAGPLPDSCLIRRHLGAREWVLCGSPTYLAGRGTPRTPKDLAEHNSLSVANSSLANRWRFMGEDGEHEIVVSGNFRSNSIEALRTAAVTGQGICLLPMVSVAADLESGRLLRLLPDYATADEAIHAVYPAGRHLSVRVRTFLDFIAKRLREVNVDPAAKQNGKCSPAADARRRGTPSFASDGAGDPAHPAKTQA